MDDDHKLQEQRDDEMINGAFQHLLDTYVASRHRKKVDIITKAFNFARQAHKGVRRLSGEPYIMHPIAVAQIACEEVGLGSTSICAALLHDVVEDTDWTFDDLRNEKIPEEIIEALQLCTHDVSKDYFEYVQQIIDSGNMTAIHVKQNDLRHNIARGKAFGYTDLVEKHEKALQMIEDFLQKNIIF